MKRVAQLDPTDWSSTSLGSMERWPQSLRIAFDLCREHPLPACIAWGSARAQLFNEHYATLPGLRTSPQPGQDFAETWRDAWPALSAHFERALSGESIRVTIDPALTLSLAPIRDESRNGVGVFALAIDTTDHAKLKRATDDLDSWDYIVSHDLLSPLRTMQQLGDLLLESAGASLTEDSRMLVQHITQGATKLAARAGALSRFTRVSQQQLSPQRVCVAEFVSQLVTQQEEAAGDRHIEVRLGHLPDVFGDPALIREVFEIMISNAFKFTRQSTETRIEIGGVRSGVRSGVHGGVCSDGRAQVMYHVRDNGAGFDMKYAGRLFGLFQRLHSEAQFEGIGVGLALAKRIVERHGGTMRAEGSSPGGATFLFSLPAVGASPGGTA